MYKLMVVLMLVMFMELALSPPTYAAGTINRKMQQNLRKDSMSSSAGRYAVIFDAGSSGSRVHVFSFDQNLDLVPVGDQSDLEIFVKTEPGLSSYWKDPKAAAESLVPLLEKAESSVPEDLRPKTAVRVGATAGLRQLEGDASERILQAVRDLLRDKSSLKYEADQVSVLTGSQEGSYMWMAINYLLGNLGKSYKDTVGIVDLGGGSVQMAYAISETNAARAPNAPDGEDPYLVKTYLNGTKYNIYVHSYLNYGLKAARAALLKTAGDSGSPCILVGYNGTYEYGGVNYKASTSASGSSFEGCRRVALEALEVNETCSYEKCTFEGVWNGGGGLGEKNLLVASFFYDIAAEIFIDPTLPSAKARPVDFKEAAEVACSLKSKDVKSTFPSLDKRDVPFVCQDLVYQYALLVDGFGLNPQQEITLVRDIKYHGSLIAAAWPLGSAIEAVSSVSSLPLVSSA